MTVYRSTSLGSKGKGLPTILWDDVASDALVSSETLDESGDFAVSNVTDMSTASRAQIPAGTSGSIDFELTEAAPVDTLGVVFSGEPSDPVSITLSYSDDGTTYTDVEAAQDFQSIANLFVFPLSTDSHTYYRVTFSNTSTSDVYIARIMFGQRLDFPRGILPPYTPLVDCNSLTAYPSMSMTGQFLQSNIMNTGTSATVRFNRVTEDFMVENVLPFKRYHYDLGYPFFFTSRNITGERDVSYCWMNNDTALQVTRTDTIKYRNISMEIAGYAPTPS